MRTSMKQLVQSRTTRVLVAAGIAAGLALMAVGGTNAGFSEYQQGGITGTIGQVHLSTTNRTFAWTNMMPGVADSAKVDFTNTGTGHQDFYLVFPNLTALSALNSLGTFGEVHIAVNGVEKFASANLNDGYPCGTAGLNGVATLCPVPQQMLLASDVAIGATNSFTFAFNYASKVGTASHSSGGGVFNTYPVYKADGSKDQNTIIASDGAGNGLQFRVVAVQVNQQPS